MTHEPQIYRLLMKLRDGGAIVRAADCGEDELRLAQNEDRYTLDRDGFGYVWRRPAKSSVDP